jgi:hypothetical protein
VKKYLKIQIALNKLKELMDKVKLLELKAKPKE